MLVSIIIPCYNVQGYIFECLDSAFQQIHRPIEVIAVDNNSTDATLSKLKEYKKLHPDLIILKESTPGASVARNKGLNIAKGEWIQFLDADDIILPHKLKSQIDIIHKMNIKQGFIAGAYYRKHQNGTKKKLGVNCTDPWIGLLRNRLGITSSNLWKKEMILKIGGWNESLKSSQESELMFNLLTENYQAYSSLATHTIVNSRFGSISNTNRRENWIRYIELRKRIVNYLRKNKMLTQARLNAGHEILFLAIRGLYQESPELALKYYNELIPKKYSPSRYSNSYKFLLKLLGFEKTEKLRKVFKGNGR